MSMNMNCCRCSICNRNLASTDNVSTQSVSSAITSGNCSCSANYFLDILSDNIGRKCNCEFETQNGIESKCGILERVGEDFIQLRSLNNNRTLYCNVCNLLFATIMC